MIKCPFCNKRLLDNARLLYDGISDKTFFYCPDRHIVRNVYRSCDNGFIYEYFFHLNDLQFKWYSSSKNLFWPGGSSYVETLGDAIEHSKRYSKLKIFL